MLLITFKFNSLIFGSVMIMSLSSLASLSKEDNSFSLILQKINSRLSRQRGGGALTASIQ
ncbi:hypothetical protein V6Z11_D06G102900 [Gossypium hirsutum]